MPQLPSTISARPTVTVDAQAGRLIDAGTARVVVPEPSFVGMGAAVPVPGMARSGRTAGQITDLVASSPTPDELGAAHNRTQIWLTWTPVPGSNGTIIWRSRQTGPSPQFQNWEAVRVAYPGGFYKDGALGPLDAGRTYTYQAVPYYNVGEGIASAPVSYQTDIAYDQGYQGYYNSSGWPSTIGSSTRTVLDEVAAQCTIPTNPIMSPWTIPGDLYFFIGVQDVYYNVPAGLYVNIFQPVIQWGVYGDADNPDVGSDSSWTIVNVILWQGRFYMSLGITVLAGAVVTGKIKRNGAGDFTVSFVEHPTIDLHMTGLVYPAGQELPAYDITAGAPIEFNFLFAAAETYCLFRDWTQNCGDFVVQMQHLNVRDAVSGVVTANINAEYSITSPLKSGTQLSITGHAPPPGTSWSTPTPLITIHLQQNNDWFPVNL